MSRRWFAAASILLVGVVLTASTGPAARVGLGAVEREAVPRTAPASPVAGAPSCSGRACHGGAVSVNDQLVQQNEYSTWVAHDSHARAYDVLRGERGKRMARNLGIEDAARDIRCLACHTNPLLAAEQAKQPARAVPLDQGIGCESCHGPANGPNPWLAEHTTETWMQRKGTDRQDAYKSHGMEDMADLAVQAKACAGCHVGAPEDKEKGIPLRDCNHDLMAAGHPRLNFEMGSFQVNMPPHWKTSKHDKDAGYNARVWAVGQVASAMAQLDLIEDRARRAEKENAPWPEFANYACFSCHADLQQHSWRRNSDYYKGRRPGSLPGDDWYFAMLPTLGAKPSAVVGLLSQSPCREEEVRKAAQAERKDVARLLDTVNVPAFPGGRPLLASFAGWEPQAAGLDWDKGQQLLLAVAVLKPTNRTDLDKPLADLSWKFRFPRSSTVRGEFDGSPERFRVTKDLDNETTKELKQLLEALKR